MTDVPIPSLARAREQKIDELATHFANDDLSLEDLERRIELVYKAASVTDLEQITEDLRRATAPPLPVPANVRLAPADASSDIAPHEVATTRMVALMSSTKRLGRWVLPKRLDLVSVMADTTIDLTQAVLPPVASEIHVRAVMTSLRIIVPPGVRVVTDISSVMADVGRADEAQDSPGARGPVIRLTGYACMAEVKVQVQGPTRAYVES